jgi:hypothetical protein
VSSSSGGATLAVASENMSRLMGQKIELTPEVVRSAKETAARIFPHVLVDENGSYSKLNYDMLAWSNTPISALFVKLCTDTTFYLKLMSLPDAIQEDIFSMLRKAVVRLATKCSLPKLKRFDQVAHPDRGPWNSEAECEALAKCVTIITAKINTKQTSKRKPYSTDGWLLNSIYINVQPPLDFQEFKKIPVKIGKSKNSGRARISNEAHAALFRELCNVYVAIGPDFVKTSCSKLGISYKDVATDCIFEHFMHQKWALCNNTEFITHYKKMCTHREMFHMTVEELRACIDELWGDEEKYNYEIRRITNHEGDWIHDHPKWIPMFT